MRPTNAIEEAVYDLIRAQELGKGTLVRCWHGLRKDTAWEQYTDRVMPCVDIRCAIPIPEDNQQTMTARLTIDIRTLTSDDPDHQTIAQMEDAISQSVYDLYDDFYAGATSTAWQTFETAVKLCDDIKQLSGIKIEQGLDPSDDDGINQVGIAIVFSYSRN